MNKFLNYTALSIWVLYLVVACQPANEDNEIYVTQTGNNLRLEWEQKGQDNVINTILSGYQLDTAILQEGNRNALI